MINHGCILHELPDAVRFYCCLSHNLVLKEPKTYYHHEMPTDLEGSVAVAATDYNKRPNVFRLKLANGAEYLFQCRDEVSHFQLRTEYIIVSVISCNCKCICNKL